MAEKLAALRYVGGKSAIQPYGIGQWGGWSDTTRRCLPGTFLWNVRHTPSASTGRREIVNDLSKRIVNWWKTLQNQEHYEKLQHWIDHTPRWSKDFYDEAIRQEPVVFQQGDTLKAAYYFTLNLTMGFGGVPDRPKPGHASLNGQLSRPAWKIPLKAIVERIKMVEIDNMDGCDFIEKYNHHPDSVWYIDPPYPENNPNVYEHQVDYERLTSLLEQIEGFCAVSGYGEEWDCLGWYKHSFSTYTSLASSVGGLSKTEKLWTNRPVKTGQTSKLF